jgi:N-acetylglucosamine-6-phosphate deacetylase
VRLGVSAALVDGTLIDGDVTIDGDSVTAVGVPGDGGRGVAVPGFVDAHINGIAGVDFLTADADGHARAAQALAGVGVVAYQPTLVSSPPEAYDAALAAAAAAMAAPDGGARVLGVHLEGPFLSREWPGAHDPSNLREPDPDLLDRVCEAGPVTMVTLAPELEGALDLVERLTSRGITVSVGHSDADAAAAHAAFDRGATAITHVHNAHRRWRARDPGPAGVALVRRDVWVQAIVDGVHLAPESALGAFLAAGSRFCLVTDAVEAAGMPPGSYRLGDRDVHVEDGAVRLADGTLAGSVLTMDAAVRNLVASGAALADAVHAASTAPARLLGRDDLGALRPGVAANIAVLNEELEVERTVVAGREAFAARWAAQAVRLTFARPGGRSGSTPRRRASASASC